MFNKTQCSITRIHILFKWHGTSKAYDILSCKTNLGNVNWYHYLEVSIKANREGNGTPLQYSCLENPMDRGAWWLQSIGSLRGEHDWATSLSLFTFMHWRRKWQPTPVFLPGESQGREPGRLPSMGSHRVGHDWSDLAAAAIQDTWVQSLGWKDPLKKGIGYSLLYSCLDNSMNRGTQWATVHRVAKCWTQLSN